jgi:hypothetical protein
MNKNWPKVFKRGVTYLIDRFQKMRAKSVVDLDCSPNYNRMMVELNSIKDVELFADQINLRKKFEAKVLEFKPDSYVKKDGRKFKLNSHRGQVSLREACLDDFGLNSRMRFSLEVVKKFFKSTGTIYLSESGTAFHKKLKIELKSKIESSVYRPGSVFHQDLTRLTYADNMFDLCLSFEDLEHIPDYIAAIRELFRVTKVNGGVLVSAPFILENEKTVTRAVMASDGKVQMLLEPEYHGDPLSSDGILCFYHFGWDLLEEFRRCGFRSVKLVIGYDINEMMLGDLLFIKAIK